MQSGRGLDDLGETRSLAGVFNRRCSHPHQLSLAWVLFLRVDPAIATRITLRELFGAGQLLS